MAGARQANILIIGGGFGGLSLGIRLKAAGIEDFVILEKSQHMGGVWRDNTYPGAACDVPSRFYSLSFEQDWPWSARFGRQDEILQYLNWCAEKYEITPHVRFGKCVKSARFDPQSGLWNVETDDGEWTARSLVSAIGIFNAPVYPDIPGQRVFEGTSFHSSYWDHDAPVEGKRVAVIGTGASAIQFVPELAKTAGKLHVCHRSPQYIQPKDMGIPEDRRHWFHDTPVWRRIERRRIFNEFEAGSSRRYSPEVAEQGRANWLAHLERSVSDPELRRKLTPDYPFGCKRMLQSNDYYPAMQQPNVELIDIPVDEILPGGIRLRDGSVREVDTIVYGTGFKPTSFLPNILIEGINGFRSDERWKDGAEAYLGITVADCPNFYMIYGPNTNAAASIIYMIEHQANYIARCIETLEERNASWLQVRADVQEKYNAIAHERLNESVVANDNCLSYFKLPSGKIVTQWPWDMREYHRRTREPDFSEYEFGGTDMRGAAE